MRTSKLDQWVTEIHNQYVGLNFKVEKSLFSGNSDFQQVDIIQTAGHGAMLLNDGVIMLSERDEFIYHEMISHVPLFVHPSPESLLVIGGGDGGSVREVLKHKDIKRVVWVEIDEMVIRACRKHMPSVACDIEDPRLDLIIDDGVKYVAQTGETFDIVIVDSTDPVGPAKPLFDEKFYKNVSEILSPHGILVVQAESVFYNKSTQLSILKQMRPLYKKLHLYLFPTMTYPGGLWSFAFASKNLCPIENFKPERVTGSKIDFRYYNALTHLGAFMLPTFVNENYKMYLDSVNINPGKSKKT